ncbi:MAG: hypothetical protein K2K74_17830 [Lachnospiraceae bacterium]|nr:hypothetical protein [Lachnospiraceae bacterium]
MSGRGVCEKYLFGVYDTSGLVTEEPPELVQKAQQSYGFPYCCQGELARSVLCEWNGDVYAFLVDSNTIVRVAAQIDSDVGQRGDGEVDETAFEHLYYADGYLYFEVTFSVCDQEYTTR